MSKASEVDAPNAHASQMQTPLELASDWRVLAEQRLARLVEIEHDHSVMLDRLALLQVDYLEEIVASEQRLAHIGRLGLEEAKLHLRLRELEDAHAVAQASFERVCQSRSWRVTRPLRAVSTWVALRHDVGSMARGILRIPLIRRTARAVARRVPGLHARIRSRLYGMAGRKGPR